MHGMGGVACLMMIMFFESCECLRRARLRHFPLLTAGMYPCIFSLATHGLGANSRRGASIIVMGVSGGAVFPPMQGAIKDAFNARVSFFIVLPCFLYIACWAAYVWVLDGRRTLALKAKPEDVVDIETRSVISVDHSDTKADFVHTDTPVVQKL